MYTIYIYIYIYTYKNLQGSIMVKHYFPNLFNDECMLKELTSPKSPANIYTSCTSPPLATQDHRQRRAHNNMHMQSDKPKAKTAIGKKRGLPVAWGRDILSKCPRLADKISKFHTARPPEGTG